MKIKILSYYDIEVTDGTDPIYDSRHLRAETSFDSAQNDNLKQVFEVHAEKVAAIERKLTKELQ